jgi:hypothetical protein
VLDSVATTVTAAPGNLQERQPRSPDPAAAQSNCEERPVTGALWVLVSHPVIPQNCYFENQCCSEQRSVGSALTESMKSPLLLPTPCHASTFPINLSDGKAQRGD